tara:strand:- start:68 stop:172 length:105 start_codon:yes stop_codon:yes gene_type:complete
MFTVTIAVMCPPILLRQITGTEVVALALVVEKIK